jgi:hypothetical protein
MILKVLFCLPLKHQLGMDLKNPTRLKIPEAVDGCRRSFTEPETKDALSFKCAKFIWHI